MLGSRFSSSTRPSSSAWVVEGCSSSFTECNPNSRHILSFERTYAREAGLSPIRMTARPGVTPFAFSSAISRRRSTYTFSAIARPSISLAIVKQAILPASNRCASKHCCSRVPVERETRDVQAPQRRASHREAATENVSAHFNQRHYGVLQSQAFRFKFLRRARRFHPMRVANQHSHLGKRSRHDEAVPTFQPPAARIFQTHRHYRRTRFLRQKNYPRTEFVSGTSRTVGSNDHIATGREHLGQLENCACPQPGAGAANHIVPKTLKNIGDQIAIAAGADQCGAIALRKETPQDKWENQ